MHVNIRTLAAAATIAGVALIGTAGAASAAPTPAASTVPVQLPSRATVLYQGNTVTVPATTTWFHVRGTTYRLMTPQGSTWATVKPSGSTWAVVTPGSIKLG